jgi:hypothetical protein
MPEMHRLGPSSSFHRELQDWGNRRGGACFWRIISSFSDRFVILSQLRLINNVVRAYIRWGNVVMPPWAIIMELDGLNANKPMSEPGFRAPHSGHGGNPASAHANKYAHLEHISRGIVRHLGLPSSVTNGEDDRSRTFVSAEEQLVPTFERFGFGGPESRWQPFGLVPRTWTTE